MSQSISKQNLRIREITIAIFAFLIFGVAHANLSPIARNADGTVLVTNQDAALSYCRSQGLHVPSAREWAVIGGTQGAQVMLQPSRPNSSVNDPSVIQEIYWVEEGFGVGEGHAHGYYPIYKDNGFVVDFYYNSLGYRPPSGLMGKYYFWTSTPMGMGPGSGGDSKENYIFDSNSGDMHEAAPEGAAVVCLSGNQ